MILYKNILLPILNLVGCLIMFGCGKDITESKNICSDSSPYNIHGSWIGTDLTPAFTFSTSLPGQDWRDAVETAAARWNEIGSRLQIKLKLNTTSARAGKDGINVVSYEPASNNSKLGEARIWFAASTNRITEVDIILNSNRPLAIKQAPGKYHVKSVVLHEFGHFVGLDHVSDNSQLMYSGGLEPNTVKTSFCSGDRLGLLTIYGSR